MVEDSQETESLTSIEDDSLQFSSAQIEYLKTEFERQRQLFEYLKLFCPNTDPSHFLLLQ